jgi:uncharacterized membrane protein
VTQPLNADRFFIRAEKTNGTPVLQGAEKFCITDIESEIIGRENCAGRGLREAGFAVSDVRGKRGYTARLGAAPSTR